MSRVQVMKLADDWEALYVEGDLVLEGHSIVVDDLPAFLPDLAVEYVELSDAQWAANGYRAPKTLEEL